MGHTWAYPIMIPFYLLGFGTIWVTPKPQNSCSKSKDDEISSIVALMAGPAASTRPPGPHPPWRRTGDCRGPHEGPRELQSWRTWAPGLESEIRPPRQARTARPPSPPCQSQSALHLFMMRLIVVFIAGRACLAGILYPSVRLSPPPSAPPRPCACCRRPPLLCILVSYQL